MYQCVHFWGCKGLDDSSGRSNPRGTDEMTAFQMTLCSVLVRKLRGTKLWAVAAPWLGAEGLSCQRSILRPSVHLLDEKCRDQHCPAEVDSSHMPILKFSNGHVKKREEMKSQFSFNPTDPSHYWKRCTVIHSG